jgi:galactose mutarotase-like enzyme
MPSAPPLLRLEAGDARLTIDPADGGRLASLVVAGHELLTGVGPGVTDHGCFVMAPWAGRIRDGVLRVDGVEHHLPTVRTHPHAGHGLVLDRPWEVLDATATTAALACALDGRWPWPGRVVAEVDLSEDALVQRLRLEATQAPFPGTLGWHPWFPRQLGSGEPLALQLDVGAMLRRDAAGIPDGTHVPVPDGPWDDCFVEVRWPVRLRWAGALSLMVHADTDALVVYDERTAALCVEPQTGPPDGPNTAPRMVTPDDPLAATTRWAWQVEAAA